MVEKRPANTATPGVQPYDQERHEPVLIEAVLEHHETNDPPLSFGDPTSALLDVAPEEGRPRGIVLLRY